jgi:hypothetical protein
MTSITRALHVIALSDRGVRCALDPSAPEYAFWLPRDHVNWASLPERGKSVIATIPRWLSRHHRQLDDAAVLEAMRDYQSPVASTCVKPETRKDTTMADVRDMSGSLSKNLKKEKETHADYVGSIVIGGRKFWLNGWIKDGQNGKFLSLSAKPADEHNGKPKPKSAPVEDEIPF